MDTEELLDELDSFNPYWKSQYKRMPDAAEAAGLWGELEEWYLTPDGIRYLELMDGVHDHIADNEARRAAIEAERSMLVRNKQIASKGYLDQGDELI